MRFMPTLALLTLLLPLAVHAQQPSAPANARGVAPGTVLADSSASLTRDGFAASMIITADPDWQKQWEAPADVPPRFTLAKDMREGEALYILLFVSNPMLDAARMADVTCDLRITGPDGKVTGDERDVPCFQTELSGDPSHVYLSTVGVKFEAEPGDPRGTWAVAINVHDNQRKLTLPLQSSFELR